jgi:putative Mg2+ transporter-C (MgtC) family protein
MISYWTILLRLVVALLLGSIVGLERERKERGAGMRTVALVTLGSTLFTIISAYGFLDLLSQPHTSLDPTRIASYIVAGIGFLGAGTIFMSRDRGKVKGLTTAASIWVMAAVGIACGVGLLLEAATTTLLTLIVLVVLSYVESRLASVSSTNARHIRIEASMVNGEMLSKVYETCERYGLAIDKLRIQSVEGADVIGLSCRASQASSIANALVALRDLPGVHLIQIEENDAGEITNFLNRGKKEN